MGSNCETGSGPAKYGFDLVEITSVTSDRFCDDPAGAKIVVEGTYTVRCTDEDSCGRELGEEYTVPFTLDGRAAQEEVTLENGDVVSVWADCSELTGEVSGEHAVDGPGRDIGGISPDCTVIFNGAAAVDLTNYTASFTWVSQGLDGELVCPGEPPFGVLELETLKATSATCTDGAILELGGTGSVECRGSGSCTAGERLSFDYTLGAGQSTPEITLSNGETLHLPYACVDANVSVWGLVDGERKRIGTLDENCALGLQSEQLSVASELTLEGDFGWLPELEMVQACDAR